MTSITSYLNNVNRLFQTGNAREHSYRGDLQQLFKDIINDDKIIVTNEPARIREVGAPDYSITKNKIPIDYIEAKDIGAKDLDGKKINKEQFYKNAKLTVQISIAKWEFHIGGYQPAQKCLKDRVGRELSRTDLKHYNKIINTLVKTDKIMQEIDKVLKV